MTFVKLRKIIAEELRDSKKFIFSIVILFFTAGIFGFIFSDYLGFINEIIKGVISKVGDLTGIPLILAILFNNLQSALTGLLLGLVFGLFPVFNAIFNGMVVGYVLSKVVQVSGYSQIWKILPHGIFELPAIFIALGLGLRLGTMFFTKSWKKNFSKRIYNACVVFVFVVLPLLIIAAIIEGLLITFLK